MSQYRDNFDRATEEGVESARHRMREGVDSARAAAHDAKDYVSSKFNDARDSVNEQWEHLRDADYDEVWDGVKTSIKENPGPAILVAGAIGLAVGIFLAGSSAAARRR